MCLVVLEPDMDSTQTFFFFTVYPVQVALYKNLPEKIQKDTKRDDLDFFHFYKTLISVILSCCRKQSLEPGFISTARLTLFIDIMLQMDHRTETIYVPEASKNTFFQHFFNISKIITHFYFIFTIILTFLPHQTLQTRQVQ